MSVIMKNAFSHGYSYYSLQENWIAALCGRLIWTDLAAIVDPEDIIQYPHAACSQQSIVLMECLKRKGIAYRAVLFPRHYAVEALIEGHWRYFDINLEPSMPENKHIFAFTDFEVRGQLPAIYNGKLNEEGTNPALGNARFGKVSASPAPKALLFHRLTKILSRTLWLIPFFLGLRSFVRRSRRLAGLAIRPERADGQRLPVGTRRGMPRRPLRAKF
jgi:hypothetical protein